MFDELLLFYPCKIVEYDLGSSTIRPNKKICPLSQMAYHKGFLEVDISSSVLTVVGHFAGLRYETVRRPAGPTDAECKLEQLTRQLEVEMRLSPSPSAQTLPQSQRSPAVSGIPSKLAGQSSQVNLQRVKHNDAAAYPLAYGNYTMLDFH